MKFFFYDYNSTPFSSLWFTFCASVGCYNGDGIILYMYFWFLIRLY